MERFKHTEATRKLYNSVLGDWIVIDSDKEMAKRQLSYDDYKAMGLLLDSLRFTGRFETPTKSIADHFGRLGCKVECLETGYVVSL